MQRSLAEIAAYPGISAAPFQHSLEVIEQVPTRLGQDQSRCEDAGLVRRGICPGGAYAAARLPAGIAGTGDGCESVKRANPSQLGRDLDELMAEYKAIWLERNRPGGLAGKPGLFYGLP